MENTLKKEYDVIFGLPDAEKVANTGQGKNYSLEKAEDDRYVLTVGDGFPCIEIAFSKETAAGLLGGYYPPNNPREASEMMENANLPASHLFIRIGNHKIDLFKLEKPSEMRILASHELHDSEKVEHLEFDMEFVWNDGGWDSLSEAVIKITLTRNEKTGAVAWWENYAFYRPKTYHEVTGILMDSNKCST